MLEFASPWAPVLLVLPVLARLVLRPRAAAADVMQVPPSIAGLLEPAPIAARGAKLHRILPMAIWVLLVFSIAGPRQLETLELRPASGRDIVIALDLSGSMETEDFLLDGETVSRLAAVKAVATRFVEGRRGDRIGLVVFADRPYFATPLTFDVQAVSRAIEEVTIGISGRSTSISDSLGLSLKRLLDSDAESRVVILLSDGADTKGVVAPQAVAEVAARNDIRIHTIAMGPHDLSDSPGTEDAVDTRTLGEIADVSGGKLFRVRTMADLRSVTQAINSLEPSPVLAPPLQYWREYWIYPAAAALLLCMAYLVGLRRYAQ